MKKSIFIAFVFIISLAIYYFGLTNQSSINDMNDEELDKLWDARLTAMESILGKSDEMHGHAVIPFDVGYDLGGAADIVYFKKHINGIGYATFELIGRNDQKENVLGNYELLIFHREDDKWGSNILSNLAYYTLDEVVNPYQTMDIGPATPDGSTIDAFIFFNYGTFKVLERDAGILLCVGITADELAACRAGKQKQVETALKEKSVYPFTDLYRESVLK